MSIPTLSPDNPELALAYCDYVGGGVTLVADDGSGTGMSPGRAPVAIARPTNDDLTRPTTAHRNLQLGPTVYGFDRGATDAAKCQKIQIKFNSEVDGKVCIAIRMCGMLDNTTTQRDTYLFGRLAALPTATSTALKLRVTLANSAGALTCSSKVSSFLATPAVEQGPFRDVGIGSMFKWHWVFSDTTAKLLARFPVVRGENTITIEQDYETGLGQAGLHEGIYVRLWTGDNSRMRPRRLRPGLDWTTKRDRISAKLALASGRPVRACWIGDSQCARADSWALWMRDTLTARHGVGGLGLRLGNGDQDATWATDGAGAATISGVSGGAAYAHTVLKGVAEYRWTTAQTGGATYTFTGTRFTLVYETIASGAGSFTYAVDGGAAVAVDTTGTDNRFAAINLTGLTAAEHSVVVAKAGAGEVRLAAVITSGETGLVSCRVSLSGTTVLDQLGNDAAAVSLLTAMGVDLALYGAVNNIYGGPGLTIDGSNSDQRAHVEWNQFAIAAGAANILPVYVDATPWALNYTTPVAYFAAYHAIGLHELYCEVAEGIERGWIPGAAISFGRWLGYDDFYGRCWYAGLFNTVTDDGTTRAVTDSHSSTAGGKLCGQTVGKLALGALAEAAEADRVVTLTTGAFREA